MSEVRKRTFTKTAAALIEYDAGKGKRDRMWNAISCTEDVKAAEETEATALAKVQEAFHEDTSDINSRDDCRLVDIGFMRRMACL